MGWLGLSSRSVVCDGDSPARTTSSASPSTGSRFTPLGIAIKRAPNNSLLWRSLASLQTMTLYNHHNSISKEVRGAARAEITSEKPPKRSGSIGKLLCSVCYLEATVFLQLTSFAYVIFINDIYPKKSTT